MKKRSLTFRLLLVAASVSAAISSQHLLSAWAAEDSILAEVDKKAPNFALLNVDGKSLSLSDFKDKLVVLEWFDDRCPFVRKHYDSGNMQSLQKKFGKRGVVWLVINSSGSGKPGFHSPAEFKQLMKEWKFASPYFLPDPDGKVGHLYKAKTTPDMYIIGKNGKLLYSGAIDDQRNTDVESIKIAKSYFCEALEEALAGKPITNSLTKPYG